MQPVRGALIPARVLEKVELVVVLGVPPGVEWDDFGDDFLAWKYNKRMLTFVREKRERVGFGERIELRAVR